MNRLPVTVTVPIPHPCLSPNARPHHMQLANAKKRARAYSKTATQAVMLCQERRWSKAQTSIVWFTKTIKHPDPDNALTMLKATFDGFKDAGLLTDDRDLGHGPIRFEKDAKNPRVEITVIPLD